MGTYSPVQIYSTSPSCVSTGNTKFCCAFVSELPYMLLHPAWFMPKRYKVAKYYRVSAPEYAIQLMLIRE